MNTVNVNFENLTEQERRQLLELVEKANAPRPWWKGTKFDIAEYEKYYYWSASCGIINTVNIDGIMDTNIITSGNACKDRTYVERRAREIKLYNLISNFAEVVNDGWEPNWGDGNETKYYCRYNHDQKMWKVSWERWFDTVNNVYFRTAKSAQRCINEVIIPFERGEL